MLWVDKVCVLRVISAYCSLICCAAQYRPRSFDKFVVHEDIASNMKKLV